jgi:hypothetical protein
MSFAHLRRHASLRLARLRELTRSQIKDLLSASGFRPTLESHFSCAVVLSQADACKSKICVPPQIGFAHLGFACAGIARHLEKSTS